MRKKNSGITLIELLIAIAIAGMLITLITRIFISGYKNYSYIERELAERREIALITEKLKMCLTNNKKIISLNSNSVVIWNADKNIDNQMQNEEITKYIYANGELNIITGNTQQTKKLEKFKLYTDCGLPETNHIVLKIESNNTGKSVFIDTSICINSNRKIKF